MSPAPFLMAQGFFLEPRADTGDELSFMKKILIRKNH